jgi:hypothetical protein
MRKKIRWSNRNRNLATFARVSRESQGPTSTISWIEQQVIAQQKAEREMTPEQRKKKQDDAETLKFLGIQA